MTAEFATQNSEDFEEGTAEGDDQLGNEGDLESEDETPEGNTGWADAMAKILGKHLPSDKPPVLAKYKKGLKRNTEEKEELKQKKLKSKERHEMLEKDHIIPDKSTTDYEKALMKIATRGVVKLFNAVSKHQKEMDAKLKSAPTEAKKSKVVESMSKSAFLDMLKNTSDKSRTGSTTALEQQKKDGGDGDKGASWDILRDDFMMGAKMKDWDREEEGDRKKKKKGQKPNMEDYVLENQEVISEESDDEEEEESEEEE